MGGCRDGGRGTTGRRQGRHVGPQRGPADWQAPPRAYLVLLVLLQQLAAVAEELLQAQLRLLALPHTLGEVCHQAAGTGEPPLRPPSRPTPHCSHDSLGETAANTGPQFPPQPQGYDATCTEQGT